MERCAINAGAVGFLQPQLVCGPKSRNTLLAGNMDKRLKELLHPISESDEEAMEHLDTMPDHGPLRVAFAPRGWVAKIINRGNAITRSFLRKEVAALRSLLPTLGGRNDYAGAVGQLRDSGVPRAIGVQKAK